MPSGRGPPACNAAGSWYDPLRAGPSDCSTLRGRLLEEIRRPLSEAHLALARHYLQSRKTGLGYGLDVADVFHGDLDLAIVLQKEQKAAVDPLARLVADVTGAGDAPLPERHRRLRRLLGALAFGGDAAGPDPGGPPPPSYAGAQAVVTGWALRQGMMRTALFGEPEPDRVAIEAIRCSGYGRRMKP